MPTQSEDQLISIITPAWKAAGFIGKTIESVQAQGLTSWEMLIVDDCSPDNTCDVIEQYTKEDDRIHLIRQEKNGGPAAARNAGLAAAKGRWIAFLDSDDLWLPSKLEEQLHFHKQQGATISYTQYRRISSEGEKVGNIIQIPNSLNYKQLLSNTAIATSTVLIDRAITNTFSMKPIYYDDFGCWLELLRNGGHAKGLQRDLMRYRVIAGSVSRNKWRSAKEVWKTYRQVEKLNLLASLWHFSQYTTNALIKYRNF